MKYRLPLLIASISLVTLMTGLFWVGDFTTDSQQEHLKKEQEGASYLNGEKPSREKMNAMRAEYFFRMLRNPETNTIPNNIRSRELNRARQLPTRNNRPLQLKREDGTLATATYNWLSAGPVDIGGRTRALGIDQRDPNTVIAGGVSGGVWKSTDGGSSWQLRTDPSQNQSVTSLAQDPTTPDNWYYSSGEFRGQSAADRGNTSFYWGNGIYKSTDNGSTWKLLPNASSSEEFRVDKFNTISRVEVSPTTGSIFIASNGFGIFRSVDDGNSFPGPPLLGAEGGQYWADIAAAPDGRLIATLSTETFSGGAQSYTPGVYVSTDDGASWTDITPSTFPDTHERSVVTFASSAPDTAYVMTHAGGSGDEEDMRLHMIDLNDGGAVASEDRSDNLPNFGEPTGFTSSQQNYNMEITVKPDDPDFVLVGGINLFRSSDGFKTAPSDSDSDGVDDDSEKDAFWVGGYDNENNVSHYPGQHADQHRIVFDPNEADVAWAGHDGGLSRTSDITAGSVEWENMDQGYVTSQYYAVDIPDNDPSANPDPRLIGGTQDNGSPFFFFDAQTDQTSNAVDISSGDGGYAYFSTSYIFVSRQEGSIIKYQVDENGQPAPSRFAFVHPSGAENQYFVHPYVVDPVDETTMYYPDGRMMWRHTSLDEVAPNNNPDGISQGWESFQAAVGGGYAISALEVSVNPSNILYYGASSDSDKPRIYRLDNASNSRAPQEISFPEAPSGAFVHDFAINPSDADEVIVVFSNYDVASIFRTTDGGQSWQNIEGNLDGTNSNTDAGPSIRSAIIIPGQNGPVYMVGTSTGIYSTGDLSSSEIEWVQEAPNSIGHAVTEYLTANNQGMIAAGTHGRGIYKGILQGDVVNTPALIAEPSQAAPGDRVTLQALNFSFSSNPDQVSVDFNGKAAQIRSLSDQQLEAEVPRGAISPGRPSNLVEVSVTSAGTTVNTSFTILPPEQFRVLANYPNPFNPSTTIPFDLPFESGVIIQIYDMSGRKVLEPVREILQPNSYSYQVDMSGLASGVYIYRVVLIPQDGSGNTQIDSGKMTLIK